MRNSWGSLVFGLGFGGVALASMMAGCGADGAKPSAGTEAVFDGGPVGQARGDGGTDGGDGGTRVIPASCSDTIKTGAETDVDCGGNECTSCIDGKACIAATDCLGGACLPQEKICATPACSDNNPNGDETDTDCGGSICKRCTTGKKCKAGTDCVSGTCNASGLCGCPKGMVIVSRSGGAGAYCIDETEVTKFQYNKFVSANVPTADQIDVCKPPVNDKFFPRGAFPPVIGVPTGLSEGVAEGFNLSLPIHYVDWCDAYAYCKWANKQLCGSITGTTADFTKPNDPASDAWYNACSGQGTNTYPYSGPFIPGLCNGGEGLAASGPTVTGPVESQRNGYGTSVTQDEGLNYVNNGDRTGNYSKVEFAQCQGGIVGLFHMSGNVAEWEDSCDANGNCRLRGGSYKAGTNNSAALACGAARTEARVPAAPTGTDEDVLKDVGFRCCFY